MSKWLRIRYDSFDCTTTHVTTHEGLFNLDKVEYFVMISGAVCMVYPTKVLEIITIRSMYKDGEWFWILDLNDVLTILKEKESEV